MGERAERCDTCRWWDPYVDEEGDGWGQCKRHAPRPMVVDVSNEDEAPQMFPRWAETAPDNWCGEWQAKDAITMRLVSGDVVYAGGKAWVFRDVQFVPYAFPGDST